MFSKEDSKRLREEFWISFGKSFPTKWILYNTKIKDFSFKFYFDTKQAWVSLDIEGDLEHRIEYWEKLMSLKSIIIENYIPEARFEDDYLLENGKEICRMYVLLNAKVSVHNKNTWQEVMLFFNETMPKFEMFFEDYREVFTN
jgi:hypothetical protein